MKIIFLDIDGVLNCFDYRRKMYTNLEYFDNLIQPEKMVHLKKIVDATGAKVVLSTSWRKYWSPNGTQVDSAGRCIQAVFDQFEIEIYDKISVLENASRNDEVWAWLKGRYSVEEYVILDDRDYGWSCDLRMHFVQTDDAGDGLTDELADVAIRVLNGELLPIKEPCIREETAKPKGILYRLKNLFLNRR